MRLAAILLSSIRNPAVNQACSRESSRTARSALIPRTRAGTALMVTPGSRLTTGWVIANAVRVSPAVISSELVVLDQRVASAASVYRAGQQPGQHPARSANTAMPTAISARSLSRDAADRGQRGGTSPASAAHARRRRQTQSAPTPTPALPAAKSIQDREVGVTHRWPLTPHL